MTKYLIHVIDQDGKPVPQMTIDYFEHENQSVINWCDSDEQYMEGFVIGKPADIKPSSESSSQPIYANNVKILNKENSFQDGVDYQTIELEATITAISYGESNMINAYDASSFYICGSVFSKNEGFINDKLISALEDLKTFSCSESLNIQPSKSTTCPPPGATNIKCYYIFCTYTDSQGNSGWCML